MATFTLIPDSKPKMSCEPVIDVAKFGDGYEQRAPKGINSLAEKWSLSFTKGAAQALAFVKARGGHEAFNWTSPLGVSNVYICRKWSLDDLGGGVYTLACDFEQVFETAAA